MLIPWHSPRFGPAYWVKYHFGDFACLSAADGRPLLQVDSWRQQEPASVTSPRDGDLVAFVTHGGRIQVCLKNDLEGIFDPDGCGIRAAWVEFNCDGSELAAFSQGELHLVETSRWRQNPLLRANVKDLLGE